MIVIPGLSQPLKAAGKRITAWAEQSNGLMVEAHSTVRRAACPRCSTRSSRLHGHYRRAIADSPCFGRPVTLAVEIRRFKCINDCCAQRTFCECIEPLAVARQRRTLRLMQGVWALGYALGGQAGARLGWQLGMPVSGPTVLRELRRAGCSPTPDPVVIGIDDWALARGHRYGTIVVDLDRHCPIELLAGRDAPTVVSWLKEQASLEVIARDRASAYADAARTAAPDAQHVADRWHLLGNLRDAVERVLLRCPDKMKEAARQASEALQLEAIAAKGLTESDAKVEATAPDGPPLKARQRHGNTRRQGRLAR